MSLDKHPDFQRPLVSDGIQVFFPYGAGGRHVLMPDGLQVAARGDGTPDFSLELVRGENPLLPPAPYGVLDFRIRPRYRSAEALALLRGRDPQAMLEHASFAAGYLRLYPLAEIDLPPELFRPFPLAWNGLGVARTLLKFSRDAAAVFKEALANETLTVHAAAEVELMGVSPRLPLRVRFDPARLLAALAALGDKEGRMSRAALSKFFQKSWELLPLEVVGDTEGVEQTEFADAMADRVRTRFGRFIPAPGETAEPSLLVAPPSSVGGGRFEWDLSERLEAPRPFTLDLHPFDEARALVREQGLEAVYRETTVPPLVTGYHAVTVAANLPAERPGVEAMGVTLRLPPKPPQRFQAVEASVELVQPDDRGAVRLRLAPTEKLEYTFRTFVVATNSRGTFQLDGEAQKHAGDRLDLTVGDFPVDFISLEASAGLLELSALRGVCRWRDEEGPVSQHFELVSGRPTVALALSRGAADATLEVEAHPLEGPPAALKLGPLPAADTQFDLHSFREYGPHAVEIVCDFGRGGDLFALELLAEGLDETPQNINVVHFTPAKPLKTWSYFAASPFAGGYRYRPRRGPGASPAAWSAVASPFERLTVQAPPREGGLS